jgi:hypothetical protein
MSTAPENLTRGIDAVERNARGQLIANDRGRVLREWLPKATWLLLVVPALAVIVQIVRWLSGEPSGWFNLAVLVVATIAVPAVALAARTFTTPTNVQRRRALIAMDRTLGSADRLATADDFLDEEKPNGFHKAAIEDASAWVEEGRIADLTAPESPVATTRSQSMIAIPAALLLLLCAFGLTFLESASVAADSSDEEPNAAQPVVTTEPRQESDVPPPTSEDEDKAEPKRSTPKRKQQSNRSTSAASSTPDEVEESRGKLTEGESSESQQSSSPSSAQGAPSSQGQPSKPGETKPKKKKNKAKPKQDQREPKEQEKKEEEPSGSTAGQGSSRGSNNNAAANDWSSKSQQSTPDQDDPDNEEDAEDDDEEQESRGGVQPNLRDRRTPVNRDLNIGLGSARPNPDANGRGGPGGQKKSRGVASLILGVPIPDRITGQPNKGRTRITQQRITPEAEDGQPVPAEDRGTRNGRVGPVHHPDFAPWLQDYVKKYFLKRRATETKKSDETTSNDGSSSSSQG